MSCDSCREALFIDGKEPPCWEEQGSVVRGQGAEDLNPGINACWLPELDEAGQRILEIRGKLIALKDLVDPGTVLRMYSATLEDIEILATVEEEMKKAVISDQGPGVS